MNKFAAMGWFKISEEDIFKEGCTGKHTSDGGHETFTAATLEKLIEQCASFAGQDDLKNCLLDSCEEAGRLDVRVYEDANGMAAREYEFAQWKKGQFRLWLVTYTFQLLQVEKIVISRNVSDLSIYAAQ